MTAQRNSDTGLPTKYICIHSEQTSAAVTETTATPYLAITGGLDHQQRSGFAIIVDFS
jgi:hypothetical protein